MQLNIDGVTIEVSRRKIKNINLYVKSDGTVLVSAPTRASTAVIEQLIRSKLQWIKSHQKRVAGQPTTATPQYDNGGSLHLWGKCYRIKILCGTRDNVRIEGDNAIITLRQNTAPERRLRVINEWYRSLLKSETERLLPQWEQITGLHCSSWHTKNMSTRWGTCNTTARRIWLSLQLATKPTECLEYVILHELAHLKERSHGKSFIKIMDQFMPNWQEIRRRLNVANSSYNELEI